MYLKCIYLPLFSAVTFVKLVVEVLGVILGLAFCVLVKLDGGFGLDGWAGDFVSVINKDSDAVLLLFGVVLTCSNLHVLFVFLLIKFKMVCWFIGGFDEIDWSADSAAFDVVGVFGLTDFLLCLDVLLAELGDDSFKSWQSFN